MSTIFFFPRVSANKHKEIIFPAFEKRFFIFAEINVVMEPGLTLVQKKRKSLKVDFLWAHGFKTQKFLPTRVTPTSKTCINYMITTKEHKIETLEISIHDDFAGPAEITLKLEKCKLTALVKKLET